MGMMRNLLVLSGAACVAALAFPQSGSCLRVQRSADLSRISSSSPLAGLFDIFSESEEKKAAKEAAFQELQRMQQRRRDPDAWEADIKRTRYAAMARRAAEAGNLPDGWGSAEDPASGKRYYFKDGVTTWDPPIEEMVAILVQTQASAEE